MNKTVLITGSAKRLGKNIALTLAKNGFNIALHYNKSKYHAEILKKEISSLNVKCDIFQADLSNENKVIKLIDNVIKKFNDLVILINNASVFKKSKFLETDIKLFNNTFNLNFKAPFILSQKFAQKIKNGQIINIIDTKISKNNFNYFAYTLSKKLLADFTKMSARELGPNIRVNAVCPGLILPPEDKKDDYLSELSKKIPLKRKGDTEDISNAVLFLISNEYITGQLLFIDGGEHL